MKLAGGKRTVEMTVGAKTCGFRTDLGNRCAIPTFPPHDGGYIFFKTFYPKRAFLRLRSGYRFRLIPRLEKTGDSVVVSLAHDMSG